MGCCNSHPGEKFEGINPPQDLGELENDKEFIENVTKIQAHIKGHQYRKNLRETNSEEINIHKPKEEFAKPCDYSQIPRNPIAMQTLQKFGPYKIKKNNPDFANLPKLGPHSFENGTVYVGQWNFWQKIWLRDTELE